METQGLEGIEKSLAEINVYHGLPLGIGSVDITSDSELVRFLGKKIKELNNPEGVVDEEVTQEEYPEWKTVNTWVMSRKRNGKCYQVWIQRNKITGKTRLVKESRFSPDKDKLEFFMMSLYRRIQFTLPEAEITARAKLESYLSESQKTMLMLTGSFCEVGRSGVVYYLRENRPTLAYRPYPDKNEGAFLCALCLHPLGYYTRTWVGVLSPSDELLSHLLFIRADEYGFWKKANHISYRETEAGI